MSFVQLIQNKNILVVDDSLTIRNYFRGVFTQLRAQVEVAENGQTALAKSTPPPDLILLDLMLPDITGLDVLEQLRHHNDTSTVVMLTGMGGVQSALAAIAAGADGYIEKQSMSTGDQAEFFYQLEQAMARRAGHVAQRQLDKLKVDFYAMVTHDLRNPTGQVLLALEMLRDDPSAQFTADQKELLEIIELATNKSLRLINNYLDFAKIDAGLLRLDRIELDLRDLVLDSVQLNRLQAQSKKQTLRVDLPPTPTPAYLDGERIKQVVENLLSNAIKYTPANGDVHLKLSSNSGAAWIEVQDTGPGIPPDRLPQLFQRFYRVPGETSRKAHGTGLGLVIAREVVEAHGGTLTVASEGVAGKGAVFTVRLPLHKTIGD